MPACGRMSVALAVSGAGGAAAGRSAGGAAGRRASPPVMLPAGAGAAPSPGRTCGATKPVSLPRPVPAVGSTAAMAGRPDALRDAGATSAGSSRSVELTAVTTGNASMVVALTAVGGTALELATSALGVARAVALDTVAASGAVEPHAVPLPALPLTLPPHAVGVDTRLVVLVGVEEALLGTCTRELSGVASCVTLGAVLPLLLVLPLLPVLVLGAALVTPTRLPSAVVRTRKRPRFSVQPLLTTRLSRKPGCVESPGMPAAVASREGVSCLLGSSGSSKVFSPSGPVASLRPSRNLATMGATVWSARAKRQQYSSTAACRQVSRAAQKAVVTGSCQRPPESVKARPGSSHANIHRH